MNFRSTFTRLRPLFIGALSLLSFCVAERVAAQQTACGVKVVVIDAGHGGPKFPGATYRGICEKDINLQVALKLGRLIEQEMPGVKVVYTRKTDKQFSADLSLDLQARANIANKADGDLFISIHANAARSTAARGMETLIMGESEKETRINEEVLYANNKEEFIDMSDQRTAAIVRAYLQNLQYTYGEHSEAMARIVQRSYEKAGYRSRGFKRQLLKVLYATDMPSILTEVGFMSNPEELKYMTSEKGQNAIARALLNAVKEYAAYVERLRLADDGQSAAPVRGAEPAQEPAPAAGSSAAEAPATPAKPAAEEEKPRSGYTIQLLASKKRVSLQAPELKAYRGRVEEYEDRRTAYRYKYCYGSYASPRAAAGDLKEVRKYFKDAFVVRYTGNEIK